MILSTGEDIAHRRAEINAVAIGIVDEAKLLRKIPSLAIVITTEVFVYGRPIVILGSNL